MTTLREAAQQALGFVTSEAWGTTPYMDVRVYEDAARLRDVLQAALAQQAGPAQEPVAWSGYDLDGMVEAFSRVIEAHYQRANPFQYPIHMDAQMALRVLRGFIPAMKAYTAPPQRKPLTEEEIGRFCDEVYWSPRQLVRAVERAHGIKE